MSDTLDRHDTRSAPYAGPEEEIDLAQLWGLLAAGKWVIGAFVLAALVCALFYLFVAQPVYRADALLQIQSEGSNPLQGVTSDLKQLTGDSGSAAQAEIEIIKSRSVLGQTVKKLQLATEVTPEYFPVIGRAIAVRRAAGANASQAVAGDANSSWPQYAWQPVTLRVTQALIPDRLYETELTVRALGGGEYFLLGPEGQTLLQGLVGSVAIGSTAQGEEVRLFVSEIAVHAPPVDFSLQQNAWLPTVENLRDHLVVAEQGKDTGVVSVSLEGTNKQEITETVNTIASTYLRQNVEAKSEQAEKSLEFLDEQLPELRADLEASETRLTEYREQNQAVDLDAEGKALLDQIVALEDRRSQLELKMAELRQSYTGEHPLLKTAREQMQRLRQERANLEKEIGTLPNDQKEILRLRRDMEVNTELYTGLLNRAQELRVIKAGTVGNVRIVDQAVTPVRAVSPKAMLVLVLSLVLGGMLGVGYVFLRAALRRGVDDPQQIENQLGLPVYAVVPFSGWLAKYSARAKRRRSPAPLLARDQGDEIAVEALRSLRTSLFFAQMEAGSSVILVTGPSPGVGKSFISSNLGHLLADIDKKVVVVDADMRKGRLHEFLDNQREPGLSQVLTGQIGLHDALRELDGSNVKFLTSGQIPPNPSELLMRESFTQVIEQLKQEFDLVLVDAPPILAVTDAAVIAASLPNAVSFMVVRAGVHPMGEIEEAVRRMSRNGRKIAGVVVNALKQSQTRHAGDYGYYQYEYKSKA